MSFDGKTPTVEIDNDITPTVADRCLCGDEVILVSGDERPPMTKQEMEIQFHCLQSRFGDWRFCNFHKETWLRVKPAD